MIHEYWYKYRTGEKWRKLRSMHGKQAAPANVYCYCPGFQQAAKRFVRNVNLQKDQDGYIDDLRQLISYWAFEGNHNSTVLGYNCNVL